MATQFTGMPSTIGVFKEGGGMRRIACFVYDLRIKLVQDWPIIFPLVWADFVVESVMVSSHITTFLLPWRGRIHKEVIVVWFSCSAEWLIQFDTICH